MVTENGNGNLSIGDAVGLYLAVLPNEKKNAAQQEINNFVRWYGGRDKSFTGLQGSSVGNYAERLVQTDSSCVQKLEIVRGFLSYAYKQNWCQHNLSVSLRVARKNKAMPRKTKKSERKVEPVYVSQEAYDKMKEELKELKEKRLKVIDDVTRAAADKDFRENAPYHAAREQKSMIEGKILELDHMINAAAIIDEERKSSHSVSVGDTVVLHDLNSEKEVCYTLVGPREVNPARGKISAASPVGKSLVGKCVGDSVEVKVPSGKLYFELKSIE